ncbi:MAG: hypothetical protein ACI9HK_005886, partial [Pirellulaceae bacterium]
GHEIGDGRTWSFIDANQRLAATLGTASSPIVIVLPLSLIVLLLIIEWLFRRRFKLLANARQRRFAFDGREKAVGSDVWHVLGQHVRKKSLQELHASKSSQLVSVVIATVLVAECDMAVVNRNQTVVAHHHPTGIPRQIFDDPLRLFVRSCRLAAAFRRDGFLLGLRLMLLGDRLRVDDPYSLL